jgi:hypothetical protein
VEPCSEKRLVRGRWLLNPYSSCIQFSGLGSSRRARRFTPDRRSEIAVRMALRDWLVEECPEYTGIWDHWTLLRSWTRSKETGQTTRTNTMSTATYSL